MEDTTQYWSLKEDALHPCSKQDSIMTGVKENPNLCREAEGP